MMMKRRLTAVGIEIIAIAQLVGDFRRKPRHVDLKGRKRRRAQAEPLQRLVVARNQMRLGNIEQAAIDQFGFEEGVSCGLAGP